MTQNLIALPSHVAVLVPSVRKAADFLARFAFNVGDEEVFEGEGTKEIYVEMEKANSLLLMEAVGPGAYRRAMEKRGPGLHHLAIDVMGLEDFLGSLAGSGWLLHPYSVKAMKKSRTAYLARPGFPALIEVQERKSLKERPLFVNEISLAGDSKFETLLKPIGLDGIVKISATNELSLGGHRVSIKDLL